MTGFQKLAQYRLLPVIVIDDAAHAGPLADALVAAGLPVAEITLRTPAAEQALRVMARRPEITLGAGTVLTVDLVKRAVDAGATYIVTPGFNPKVVEYCLAHQIPVTPGISTCTEIEFALAAGAEVLKFFPAESIGGAKALRAICAPYSQVKFIPTGGITEKTLGDYLSIPQVMAVGGSWMVSRDLLNAGRFDEITRLTRAAVQMSQKS
ncbi:MAG: bifunctional 4-hydroxy-2-oxoglutarate aldolase/2-dehydro-3-deoxy-phosphogluconate aldolase [Phycisphaerales bacterium]|nr:bifunctional 4-hydroxy-2-oxoglutarate aldolase/2-dehydro-3-deoxy-phosphogluconate aldolase [Phycisphaerales bacterium]